MAKEGLKIKRPRQRASKACQRCSDRKVKCDAADVGLPCTRCRSDGIEKCAFIHSRRGTYNRAAARSGLPRQELSTKTMQPSVLATVSNSAYILSPPGTASSQTTPTSAVQTPSNARVQAHSLTSMFETFLKSQGQDAEDLIGKYGIVLLGDSSPLTLAFDELGRSQGKSLHEGVMATFKEPPQSIVQRQKHPSHLSAADILYLESKGAFTLAPPTLCYGLFDAFIDHFYPFYSVFDQEKIKVQHRSFTMPWILIHAISSIGASYCPMNIIQDAGYETRQQCRRVFYEKAKVLYDLGYETNRVVLLQAIFLLTFWGPDMKSYWNPCSWIGLAVTIAESLGIHRPGESKPEQTKEGRVLRRLWWMITVRDVYCASLLGHPSRVNLAHCDAPILNLNDFEPEEQASTTETPHGGQTNALYQIELLKLSLIMRKIVNVRYNSDISTSRQQLYHKLENWMSALPPQLSWSDLSATSHVFCESLKVLFYHHLIFLYMARQSTSSVEEFSSVEEEDPEASRIAEHAAHMVSTTSLSLVTKSLVHLMPQEVVAGYFVAALVFFRLIRQSHSLIAQLARAAFENCQILLNQVRDRWDSAFWGLRVIDFLVSASATSTTVAQPNNTNVVQHEASVGVDLPVTNTMLNTGIPSTSTDLHLDNAYFGNMFDNLQTSEDHLLLPTWTFYDQDFGFLPN